MGASGQPAGLICDELVTLQGDRGYSALASSHWRILNALLQRRAALRRSVECHMTRRIDLQMDEKMDRYRNRLIASTFFYPPLNKLQVHSDIYKCVHIKPKCFGRI